MKRRFPARPEQFKLRVERIRTAPDVMFRVTPIAASEFRLALLAYYGSAWRAAWEFLRYAIVERHDRRRTRAAMWICDHVGWTKLYDIPGHPGCQIRHGRKCQYLNCTDINCINKSVPKWFQKLTGMP